MGVGALGPWQQRSRQWVGVVPGVLLWLRLAVWGIPCLVKQLPRDAQPREKGYAPAPRPVGLSARQPGARRRPRFPGSVLCHLVSCLTNNEVRWSKAALSIFQSVFSGVWPGRQGPGPQERREVGSCN